MRATPVRAHPLRTVLCSPLQTTWHAPPHGETALGPGNQDARSRRLQVQPPAAAPPTAHHHKPRSLSLLPRMKPMNFSISPFLRPPYGSSRSAFGSSCARAGRDSGPQAANVCVRAAPHLSACNPKRHLHSESGLANARNGSDAGAERAETDDDDARE